MLKIGMSRSKLLWCRGYFDIFVLYLNIGGGWGGRIMNKPTFLMDLMFNVLCLLSV